MTDLLKQIKVKCNCCEKLFNKTDLKKHQKNQKFEQDFKKFCNENSLTNSSGKIQIP